MARLSPAPWLLLEIHKECVYTKNVYLPPPLPPPLPSACDERQCTHMTYAIHTHITFAPLPHISRNTLRIPSCFALRIVKCRVDFRLE